MEDTFCNANGKTKLNTIIVLKCRLLTYCLIIFFIASCNSSKTEVGENADCKSFFGYRPEGMSMWDTWYIENEGELHVFYLQWKTPGSKRSSLDENSIGHAVSKDMIHWQEKPCVLPPGTAPDDDLQPWTGCVVKHDDLFYLFYTMRSKLDDGKKQKIGLATSSDLYHWERYGNNPVIEPDSSWYVSPEYPASNGIVDCRDFVVIRHPEKGWIGYFAARVHADELAKGAVVAAAKSNDLIHWGQLPPVFIPEKYSIIEVPDVFFLNGKWYLTCLTGNNYGNRGIFSDPFVTYGTVYAVADKPEGPFFELPDDNVLMGGIDYHAGHSLRSVLFKGKMYAFYTQSFYDYPRTLSPPMSFVTDTKEHLRLAYSDFNEIYKKDTIYDSGEVMLEPKLVKCRAEREEMSGKWSIQGEKYIGASETGWQICKLFEIQKNVEIQALINLQKGVAGGIVYGSLKGNKPKEMVFMLDANEQIVHAAKTPAFNDQFKRKFHVRHKVPYHFRILIRYPWIDVYLDNILILQFSYNMDELLGGSPPCLGLFVDRGVVEISNINVYELKE